MRSSPPTGRALLPIVLLAGFLLLSLLRAGATALGARDLQQRDRGNRANIELLEEIQALRAELPARGQVGHLLDRLVGVEIPGREPKDDFVRMWWIQHAALPLWIGPAPDCEVVLAVFEDPRSLEIVRAADPGMEVEDRGGGLYLLRRSR